MRDNMKRFPSFLAICLICLSTSLLAEDTAEKKEADKPKLKSHTVKAESFKIQASVKGTFDAKTAHYVKSGVKKLANLKILKAVPHGANVNKGQPIIWFDTEKVDEQILTAEQALQLSELAWKESELTNGQADRKRELARLALARRRKEALEDYDNFVKQDRELNEKSAKFSLIMTRGSLENAMEELKQLEKMYKEDELTEESEEIVLKRARRSVDSAKFRLEAVELQTARSLKQDIPRQFKLMKDALAHSDLAFDKSAKMIEVEKAKQGIQRLQQKIALDKQKKEFDELRTDRKQLVVLAPANGILYYGKLNRGVVGDGKAPSYKLLAAEMTVTNSQVLATVASAAAMTVRLDLEEKLIEHVRSGNRCEITPVAFPTRKLSGSVSSINFIPSSAGKFECAVNVKGDNREPLVVPGMSCSVEIIAYEKADALIVPAAAVHREGARAHVMVIENGKDKTKRPVKLGHSSGGKTEIINGLKAGDVVALD
ncbi:MAG: HlyD family secretion protein [Pirellulaceae bacterium]|jgi:HlyD family secretion protein